MFNLGKLTKLFYTFRSIPLNNNGLKAPLFNLHENMSLFDVNRQYFAGRPKQPKSNKNKEITKSVALSDEKAAKLSKAEEEAEAKKKKMEAERARQALNKAPEKPIKTQDISLETKISKEKLQYMVERMQRERLGLDPDDVVPVEPKPRRGRRVRGERKIKAEKKIITLNTAIRRKTPSLRNKVVKKTGNRESKVNRRHWREVKAIEEPAEDSMRTGVIATKVGMTALFDKWGVRHALTVLQVDRCQVIQVKTEETDGYTALQLGAGERSFKRIIKPEIGHFLRAGTPVKKVLREFHVTPENILPVGFQLSARHFTPGQFVDIMGTSVGRGFQGTVKRFGFKLQPKTHGNSRSHRMLGSTGQRQDPGRVFKNKKMPGRMGGNKVIVNNMPIYKIDMPRALIYVKGSVPGKAGTSCFIKDSVRLKHKNQDFLNFPTFVPQRGAKYASELIMKPRETDPFEDYLHDNDIVDKE